MKQNQIIKQYLEEAILSQKQGKEIKPVKKSAVLVTNELFEAFKKNSQLKKSFDQLASFKQREYAEYIIEAKRDDTKQKRLYKIVPLILKGKGLNDKYRR